MKDFILYAGFWIRSMKYVIPESGVMFNVLADPLVKLIFYYSRNEFVGSKTEV